MKKYFGLYLIFVFIHLSPGFSQILEPAKWSYATSKEEVHAGDEMDLIFLASIDPEWYLYSSDFELIPGPQVTSFTFEAHPSYELIGDIRPVGAKKKYDDIWEGEYTYFVGKAEFRQKIRVLDEALHIAGSYEYQVCTDVDGRCIPFEDEFFFDQTSLTGSNDEGAVPASNPKGSTEKDSSPPKGEKKSNRGLWGFLAAAFLGGLATLLTPCVFPVIPMTVTFFLKGEQKKNGVKRGILFGVSIILIYTTLGILFTILFGAGGLNFLATHWIPNLFIFIIFIIFALSFLGMFEITLPGSLVNKADQMADRGGLIGIFFMALTLGLVSFSCTFPIVGTILFWSYEGEILRPVLSMLSYSLALAIPFSLFAIFPHWLKNLPKSGGWLNAVKVVLGFLELALALKFLSQADLAYHWQILDRDVFLALWISIFSLMGLYLLGKIRLPHDSEIKSINVPRLLLATITLSFVLYLIPGLFGAPLKFLAGILPPAHTHDFDISAMIQNNENEATQASIAICDDPKYSEFLHFPHGIKGYFDYEQALACARSQKKPLFIDFTGHACANCRQMEANVWADPRVLKRLKEDFVVVALYVDDKTQLPEPAWYQSSYDGKIKKSIGKQNADLQITKFKNNAQPFYVLLGPDEEKLVENPIGYEKDIQKFIEYMDQGLKYFNEKYKNSQ